jgi:REP element-mobilizing transposase RayT
MTADSPNENPRKERLRRLDRIFPSWPIYFVTACAFERRSILALPEVHGEFLRFAANGEAHDAYVGAYAIMPDHLHLFVALEPDKTLSDWVKSLKNALSKTLRAINVPSPHFGRRVFSIMSFEAANRTLRNGNMFGTIQCGPDW